PMHFTPRSWRLGLVLALAGGLGLFALARADEGKDPGGGPPAPAPGAGEARGPAEGEGLPGADGGGIPAALHDPPFTRHVDLPLLGEAWNKKTPGCSPTWSSS